MNSKSFDELNVFETITAAQAAVTNIHLVLDRMMREFPSLPLQVLVGQAAMYLLEQSMALKRLDEIAINTKKRYGRTPVTITVP
jgi:hypothetical protein